MPPAPAVPGRRPGHYWRSLDGKTASLHGCPALTLHLGRDAASSGVTIHAQEPSGGTWPHSTTVLSERWAKPIVSLEEALEIAIQALQTALGKIRFPDPPADHG